jgi:DNA-binding NarL/FixJ family response regulator
MKTGNAVPIRVLVADDEPHIRAVITTIAKALGADVVAEAADGREAVALFRRTRPDLVILDINMPNMRGDEALPLILALDPKANVIMMTSQDSIDTVSACIDRGARHYILKSNRGEDIYRLMAECWPRASSSVPEAA